jgi:hypothetical protein
MISRHGTGTDSPPSSKNLKDATLKELLSEVATRITYASLPMSEMLSEIERRSEKIYKSGSGDDYVSTVRYKMFCAHFFGVPVESLSGRFKTNPYVSSVRLACIAGAREHINLSSEAAAKLFGRKDHGSALHATKRAESCARVGKMKRDLGTAWIESENARLLITGGINRPQPMKHQPNSDG